uniref:PiggyBac transposable element-derived protein domain-containing protein n=1 Tax=Trichuris muris TaxID=70415 RepID=A0A5S6QTA3_TRIMR
MLCGSFDMNDMAGVRLNAAMRRVTEEWLLKNPVPVGGSGLTVEVDESLFSKRKYNRVQVLPQAWVVGGVCRERCHCFLAVLQIGSSSGADDSAGTNSHSTESSAPLLSCTRPARMARRFRGTRMHGRP